MINNLRVIKPEFLIKLRLIEQNFLVECYSPADVSNYIKFALSTLVLFNWY